MNRCRSCQAEIRWAKTASGKRMPLDPEPCREGNIDVVWVGGQQIALVLGPADALAAQADGHELFLSHFVSCPNAGQHRRSSEPARAQATPQKGPVICDA